MTGEPSPQYHYPLFTISEPGPWVDSTMPRLLLEAEGELVPNVSFIHFPADEAESDLESQVANHTALLQQDPALSDVKIRRTGDLTVAGEPAKIVEFDHSVTAPAPEGKDGPVSVAMRCAQVYVVRDGLGFVVTLTAAVDQYDHAMERFRALLGTLKFR